MRVRTDQTSVYPLIRELQGDGVSPHGNSKRKISSTGKKMSSEEDRTHEAASSRTANPTHYQRAIPARIRHTEP